MHAQETLLALYGVRNYYDRNRQVGHTTAMLNGALARPETIVVVHDGQHDRAMQLNAKVSHPAGSPQGHRIPIKTVTLAQLAEPSKLHSQSAPMVFDHYALRNLVSDAIGLIEELRRHNDRLVAKIAAAKNALE
jgi:hypothetical protein